MKKIILIIFTTIFSLSAFAQEWSDYMHGIDSIWNVSSVGNVNGISMEILYNYKDSILYMGGGLSMQIVRFVEILLVGIQTQYQLTNKE